MYSPINTAIINVLKKQVRSTKNQEIVTSDRRPFVTQLMPRLQHIGGPEHLFASLCLSEVQFGVCEGMLESWGGWDTVTPWIEYEEVEFKAADKQIIKTSTHFPDDERVLLHHTHTKRNAEVTCFAHDIQITFSSEETRPVSVSLYSHVTQVGAAIVRSREFNYRHWTYLLFIRWPGQNLVEADLCQQSGHPHLTLKITCNNTTDPLQYCTYSLLLKVMDDIVQKFGYCAQVKMVH